MAGRIDASCRSLSLIDTNRSLSMFSMIETDKNLPLILLLIEVYQCLSIFFTIL